jgi:hypothetical protein
MFGKYNGFVSKARVSACMYFLVILYMRVNFERPQCRLLVAIIANLVDRNGSAWKIQGKFEVSSKGS